MRGRFVVVLAALLAGPALAEEAGTALRAKALASAAGSSQETPREPPKADPWGGIFEPPPVALPAHADAACATARELCYDPGERRIVYRGARRLMPAVPGLTPESVAVRHDRVVLRYSFR